MRLPPATWWLKWGLLGGVGLEDRNTQKVEFLEANVLSKFHLRAFCSKVSYVTVPGIIENNPIFCNFGQNLSFWDTAIPYISLPWDG